MRFHYFLALCIIYFICPEYKTYKYPDQDGRVVDKFHLNKH